MFLIHILIHQDVLNASFNVSKVSKGSFNFKDRRSYFSIRKFTNMGSNHVQAHSPIRIWKKQVISSLFYHAYAICKYLGDDLRNG